MQEAASGGARLESLCDRITGPRETATSQGPSCLNDYFNGRFSKAFVTSSIQRFEKHSNWEFPWECFLGAGREVPASSSPLAELMPPQTLCGAGESPRESRLWASEQGFLSCAGMTTRVSFLPDKPPPGRRLPGDSSCER